MIHNDQLTKDLEETHAYAFDQTQVSGFTSTYGKVLTDGDGSEYFLLCKSPFECSKHRVGSSGWDAVANSADVIMWASTAVVENKMLISGGEDGGQ